jgi:N-terminal acetyltransferase B complex non-catalytic subunit
LIEHKVPKEYRPTGGQKAIEFDCGQLLVQLYDIRSSLSSFLYRPGTPHRLTGPEAKYFEALYLVSGALEWLLSAASGGTAQGSATLVATVYTCLDALAELAASRPEPTLAEIDVYYSMTDMHTLSVLQRTALAIHKTAQFGLTFLEQLGPSGSPPDSAVSGFRDMEARASTVITSVEDRIRNLKSELAAGEGWLDRVLDWTFPAEETQGGGDVIAKAAAVLVGGRAGAEEWAGRVLDSWREGLGSWTG